MRIIPRSEWGARYASAYRNYDAPLPADEVWLHHSVTIAPDLVPPFADDYAAIRRLEQIGQDRFGWGISYTWPITPAGLIFQGHRVDGVGTHTGGRNSRARAICFVGNYENDEPTDAQLDAAAWLLRHAKAKGWIRYARLNGGHRDVKQTACPGGRAYAAIPEINRRATAPLEEDDMPTAKEIVDELLDRKVGYFHNDPNKKNPVNVKSALAAGARYSFWTLATVQALKPLIKAAAEGKALSAEQVKEIADAAAAAVPDELAADVVDELSERLTEGTPTS